MHFIWKVLVGYINKWDGHCRIKGKLFSTRGCNLQHVTLGGNWYAADYVAGYSNFGFYLGILIINYCPAK